MHANARVLDQAHTTLLPDQTLVPGSIEPLLHSVPSLPRPPHAQAHEAMAQVIERMRTCPAWGLPEGLSEEAKVGLSKLHSSSWQMEAPACPLAYLKIEAPTLHDELSAYISCAMLQQLEGLIEPGQPAQAWSRERCFQALESLRALLRHEREIGLSSYGQRRYHSYVPPAPVLFTGASGFPL